MDPLFLFFQGNLPSDYKIEDTISNLSLNPLPLKNLIEDDFSRAFTKGGNILANLDSIFNFSDTPRDIFRHMAYQGKLFADISTGPRGGSEYWIWRNRLNRVLTSKDTDIMNFRYDVDSEKGIFQIDFSSVEKRIDLWKRYVPNKPQLIGSTDTPRTFDVFIERLEIILTLSSENAWFFLSVPDDQVIEDILKDLKNVTHRLSVIRIISSPVPWLVGIFKSDVKMDLKNYKKKGLTKKLKGPLLNNEFMDYKQASIIWKIPYSYHEEI